MIPTMALVPKPTERAYKACWLATRPAQGSDHDRKVLEIIENNFRRVKPYWDFARFGQDKPGLTREEIRKVLANVPDHRIDYVWKFGASCLKVVPWHSFYVSHEMTWKEIRCIIRAKHSVSLEDSIYGILLFEAPFGKCSPDRALEELAHFSQAQGLRDFVGQSCRMISEWDPIRPGSQILLIRVPGSDTRYGEPDQAQSDAWMYHGLEVPQDCPTLVSCYQGDPEERQRYIELVRRTQAQETELAKQDRQYRQAFQ